MKLLVECNVFKENEINILKACKALRVDCCMWNSVNSYPPYKDYDNKVFFYGSLITAHRLKKSGYRYQIWLNESFDYNYWGGHLFDHILNKNFRILPYGAIKNSTNTDRMFIKSNSCMKRVVGDVRTIQDLKHENLSPEDMLILASEKKIGKEYRVIIGATDQEFNEDSGPIFTIVDNSEYGWENETLDGKLDKKTIDNIESILYSNYSFHPYPMWVMDITNYMGETKIIEVNSLNTSGWYNCNCEKVISEILRVCKEDVL